MGFQIGRLVVQALVSAIVLFPQRVTLPHILSHSGVKMIPATFLKNSLVYLAICMQKVYNKRKKMENSAK